MLFRFSFRGLAFLSCLLLSIQAHSQNDWKISLQQVGFDIYDPPKRTPKIVTQSGNSLFNNINSEIVIVNFWAKWCAPCIHELPSLNRLSQTLSKNLATIIAISEDFGSFDSSRAFLNAKGAPDLILEMDQNGKTLKGFGGVGLPLTVIIDKSGKWYATLEGPADWDNETLKEKLETFLNEIKN